MDAETTGPNADQIAYWNSEAGRKWADNQERMDGNFAELTQAAVAFAAVAPGMRVVDVGCGCGGTTLMLAEATGGAGSVLGVDVSRPMLDVAQHRAADMPRITLTLADAATHPFPADGIDLLFSRFGVMFFDDPPVAFANMRRGMAKAGRVAFVCWRTMSDNPFFLVPWLAVKPFLPPQPSPDPTAPGPFAFADPDRVRTILQTAGFHDIVLARHDLTLHMGTLERALDGAMKIGPASRALNELDGAARAEAVDAIDQALRTCLVDDQVQLGASVWLVSAKT